MAFPKIEIKKQQHKFLWWKWEKDVEIRDGWEDLGETPTWEESLGGGFIQTMSKGHALCRTTIHIGREENEPFAFCPLCMVKLEFKN